MKYPKKNRYMPYNFESKPSDNSKLRKLTAFGFSQIQPDTKCLGINKPSVKITTTIKYGVAYVLHASGTNLFKIGCTSRFNMRFKAISSASPLPINVWKYGECDNPHLLEKHLHKVFVKKYFKNEWFALNGDDLGLINEIYNKYFDAY